MGEPDPIAALLEQAGRDGRRETRVRMRHHESHGRHRGVRQRSDGEQESVHVFRQRLETRTKGILRTTLAVERPGQLQRIERIAVTRFVYA